MNTPGDSSHRLVGESRQIREIRSVIAKLARSRAPVLLLGESGTGKEVVARAIHAANPLGQFVTVDCGSLVGPLMESELFGYTKGAFTGADSNKQGLIDQAAGGTVFFDEIGDLPLDMQVRLLRLLQEREYRPVGALQTRKVDLRVIAATHRDLARRVAEGTFRQDLYYRLNVGRIRLPPLRERKDDIPLLMEHLLSMLGCPHRFTAGAVERIEAYDWPGNVRELRNILERVVLLNPGPRFEAESLPTELQNHWRGLHSDAAPPVDRAEGGDDTVFEMRLPPVVLPLPEAERRAIEHALGFTKGDRQRAARLLQISRTTLYRKLKEYQLTA